MAYHLLTSLSASPGVSTTALAWAQLSDRPTLLVEADPVGGSPLLSLAFAGERAHDRSILELANYPAAEYLHRLWEIAIPLPGHDDQRWLVPTTGWAEQARSLAQTWAPLGAALRRISGEGGVDVLVDLGRLHSAGGAAALLDTAESVLVMTDTTLPALNTLNVGLPAVRDRLDATGSSRRLAVVPLLGQERGGSHRPYTGREIAGLVKPTSVLPGVQRDVKDATAPSFRPRSSYARSIRALVAAATEHARSAAEYLEIA